MKSQIKSTIIPWLVLFVIVLKAIVDYIVNNPSFAKSDEILLYAILFIILWIEREGILSAIKEEEIGYPVYGFFICTAGLFVYIVGRLYPLLVFEIWGFILTVAGLITVFAPKNRNKSAISIGIAGTILVILGRIAPELLSSRLAVNIASFAAELLSATVLPVVSNGVYLYFGPYTAEVTHACSGMNSIFSLFALSLLYLKEGIQRKYWHLFLLVLVVIPVAILTNTIRVIILVLTTWNFGERVSSGPFHEVIGVIVFIIALFILLTFDRVLMYLDKSFIRKQKYS